MEVAVLRYWRDARGYRDIRQNTAFVKQDRCRASFATTIARATIAMESVVLPLVVSIDLSYNIYKNNCVEPTPAATLIIITLAITFVFGSGLLMYLCCCLRRRKLHRTYQPIERCYSYNEAEALLRAEAQIHRADTESEDEALGADHHVLEEPQQHDPKYFPTDNDLPFTRAWGRRRIKW